MSAPKPSSDPYATLGVSPGTPFNEVRVVHRRLVRELHPDVNPNARARFDAVQEAFEILRARHASSKPVDAAKQAPSEPDVPLESSPAPQAGPSAAAAQMHAHATESRIPSPQTMTRPPSVETRPPVVERRPPSVEMRIPAPSRAPSGAPALNLVVVPGRDPLLLQPRAQMLYILLEFKLGEEVGSSTQPLNLSLVLDHSSSMQRDDKLQRLKEAVARIIDLMDPRDYLSIVTFGDRASVLLPSSPLGTKRVAKEALDGIRARGGTEISTGIRAGLQELQSHSANLISQMIVLTDGQTYGDEDVCLALASQASERQIQLTALGLGDDWNSALLDELAARTGGQADYVQSAEQLSTVFGEQLRTLQLTALRNIRMTIDTAVSSRVLRATWVAPGIKPLPIPAETSPASQPLQLELGRISADRDYRLLLELVVASRDPGPTDIADIGFQYDVPSLGRENETIQHRLGTTFVQRWETEPPVDRRVHDALRKITAHRLQEQAMQAIQEGQTQKGTASLRTAAMHLEAAGCPELAGLAKAEANRVERQGQAQAGNMKRIIYGTRRLG